MIFQTQILELRNQLKNFTLFIVSLWNLRVNVNYLSSTFNRLLEQICLSIGKFFFKQLMIPILCKLALNQQ
ncbi:hypothetical protein NIES2130_29635 [Scytonema sp. HK-05]|nr:hypothetical protein NIES2130_29635 [Scytonema sp. HK-05]